MKKIIILSCWMFLFNHSAKSAERLLVPVKEIHTVKQAGQNTLITLDALYNSDDKYIDHPLKLRWNKDAHKLSDARIYLKNGDLVPETEIQDELLIIYLPTLDINDTLILHIEILLTPQIENLFWYEMSFNSLDDSLTIYGDKSKLYFYPDDDSFKILGDSRIVSVRLNKSGHNKHFLVANNPLPEFYLQLLDKSFSTALKNNLITEGVIRKNKNILKNVQDWIIENINDSDESIHYLPYSVTRTYQTREGNCLDRTALCLSMLHTEKIKAYPALIYNEDNFLTPDKFRHSIVLVETDNKRVWMDMYGLKLDYGTSVVIIKDSKFIKTTIQKDDGILW